ALLAEVKNGELVLPDISAVKAALAIQRLKLLPIEIKWENMPFIRIISLGILFCVFISAPAMAESAESAEGAEGTEEGGGGPKNTEYVEYTKRLNKMTQLKTRVDEAEKKLQEYIRLK